MLQVKYGQLWYLDMMVSCVIFRMAIDFTSCFLYRRILNYILVINLSLFCKICEFSLVIIFLISICQMLLMISFILMFFIFHLIRFFVKFGSNFILHFSRNYDDFIVYYSMIMPLEQFAYSTFSLIDFCLFLILFIASRLYFCLIWNFQKMILTSTRENIKNLAPRQILRYLKIQN